MTGLDPHTSLAMTYLRCWIRENSPAKRGTVRLVVKVRHQLLMHWSVCAVKEDACAQMVR